MMTSGYIKLCVLGLGLVAVLLVVIKNSAKIKKFIIEVFVELKKVSWSTRKELIDATWIVLLSSVILGVFIGGTDFVLFFVLSKILGT